MKEGTAKKELHLTRWARVTAIVSGIVTFGAGVIVLIFPEIDVRLLRMILSVGLLFLGLERIATGISGKLTRED